ncbi:MAG: L-aspartate oxidase [Phycisphaerales bacterium]|jgi:L-aspartate oxidase
MGDREDTLFNDRRYLIPFRSSLLPQIFCDVLVIGGGVAGMRAAAQAGEAGADVIVLSKGPLTQTNTAWAQGGIAGVLRDDDSVESHVQDTMEAGAGLCDEPAVRLVCEQGPARIRELMDWGMALDRGADGELSVGREGGHSAFRIYHAGGDRTGLELERTLSAKVASCPSVRVFEGCFSLDLITEEREGGAVLGAITHHPKHGLQMIWARCTVLASGGSGQVFRETTNPRAATGDGLAMAYRAGARLADMAFVQFHPTVLYVPGAARALISEAVRGEGALLRNDAGERFMVGEHDLAELAPRDIVSRAIVRQISRQGGGRVWLDCRGMKGFAERFPGIDHALSKFDLNASKDLIPVHPAAHYTIGGVRTDLQGRTGVPGLLAIGEAACSGLHGANRLASNSLLEGLVFGQIAGELAAAEAARTLSQGNGSGAKPVRIISDIRPSEHAELDLSDVRSSLQSAMWKNLGVERHGARVEDAVDMLGFWGRYTLDKIFEEPEGWEVQNMLQVAWLIAQSAANRPERRGTHWRTDAPEATGLPGQPAVHDLQVRGGEPTTEPVILGEPIGGGA